MSIGNIIKLLETLKILK